MSKRTSHSRYSISQNYLTSTKTINSLLRRTSICKNDLVIEIGAGKGHITKQLAKISHAVIAYEADTELSRRTEETISAENVSIISDDFLKSSLPKTRAYKIFSNIPFSITTDIIRKLTTAPNPPAEAWLVMEKGAAKRFMGKPSDTLSSLTIKPFFEMEIVWYFSRQDFHPAPSVDTVLLHLTSRLPSDIPYSQREQYTQFLEKSINYGINRLLTKRQVSLALKLAGQPCIPESGIMLYVQWLCLFRCYCKIKNNPGQ